MTLTREMQTLSEKLAENSHDLWAKRKKIELEEIGESIYFSFAYHFSVLVIISVFLLSLIIVFLPQAHKCLDFVYDFDHWVMNYCRERLLN